MMKTLGRCLIPLFALALASCGAELAPAPEAPAGARGAALTTTDNPEVELECGRFDIQITRATRDAADQDTAEERCAADIRDSRPTVSCPSCPYRGGCKPLTRRSDIVQNCARSGNRWRCECAQRSVLGCRPCVRPDPGAVPGNGGAESCAPGAAFSPPETVAPPTL